MRWRARNAERWRRASLSRRLLIGAGVFIMAALVVATIAIGFVLHRFITGQIDQRLDTQIAFLASLMQINANDNDTLSISGATDGPPFDRPGTGWYWQVNGPANTLRSQALGSGTLDPPDEPRRPQRPRHPRPPFAPPPIIEGLRPGDGPGPDGRPLHFRIVQTDVHGVPVTIVASAPRQAVTAPLRGALVTLATALLVLGLALVAAMFLQVRLGLRPLERLRRAIADVRSGTLERVPEDQPREVAPVVTELNALLAQNAANLDRARAHVANLAHGLKTPLATLALAVAEKRDSEKADVDHASLSALVGLMERRIRHHLGRARMAAMAGPMRARTPLAPRLGDLASALRKIHAGKNIAVTIETDPSLAAACEQQDFDEMAGNLLDNAFKWARGAITVSAQAHDGQWLTLSIDDDGAGLSGDDIARALQPGARLDESAPGFGFGLPIARELAELYGGALSLTPSAKGGLRAALTLPRASEASV